MFVFDCFIWLMNSELERIGNDDRIWLHIFENPWFYLCHLVRKKIRINVVIAVEINLRKIFSIKM